jgi:hypothetical protein
VETRQFIACARSGKVRDWLNKISQHLSTFSGHSLRAMDNALLEGAKNDVENAMQQVLSLLLA